MGKIDCLKLAKEFALKEWNFDIVNPAGEEDGWHYFSCTREGRPHYSSMPVAIRIDKHGTIEELGWAMRMKVIRMADKLINSKN